MLGEGGVFFLICDIVLDMDKSLEYAKESILNCQRILNSVDDSLIGDATELEKIIPLLGLNGELLYQQPEELGQYYGTGLHIWQYPNQLSKYFSYLNTNSTIINSYLEIGTRWGGTLVATVEYLIRIGCEITKVATCDTIKESNLITAFRELHPEIEFHYLQKDSTSQDFKDFCSSFVADLVLIDGDHSYEGVKNDFFTVKNTSKIIVQHDVANLAPECRGTVAFWKETKSNYSDGLEVFEFIDQYDSVDGSYLGIGVLKIKD